MRLPKWTITAAVVGLIAVPTVVIASAQAVGRAGHPSESPTQPTFRTPDESIDRDGEAYAQAYHVSLAEGSRRIRAQIDSFPVVAAVRQAAGEREAAIWLEHTPQLKFVALFTGARDEIIAKVEGHHRERANPL